MSSRFFKKVFVALSCFFAACQGSTSDKPSEIEVTSLSISSLGSSIAYTDTKKGDTTLLFIHGWGINRRYWENQVDYFKDKYRVVTIDLPGYGESGNHTRAWGPETYVQDIDSIVDALALKNVILIGHSMSGATVIEAGLKHPGRFIGIVGVDNMKDVDMKATPEMTEQWNQFYQAARSDFKGSIEGGIDALFATSTDSLIKQRVTKDILASDTTMTMDCLEAMDKYPFATKLPLLKQPVYLIESAFIPTDTAAFTKLGVAYVFYDMGNVGHYPMLENSSRFNALLENIVHACGKQ
ncbi:MAG: alpha/beta fold hydrolase [Sphingobacteriales bacterium]|jgi:pimeloyl-ACP methyl ester carboxylesterase